MSFLTATLFAAAMQTALTPEACLKTFENGTEPVVSCSIDYRLPDKDRTKLKSMTADVLQDAQCAVALSIDRARFFEGLLKDRVDLEAQPVACQVKTSGNPLDVRFEVAPMIEFADGRAAAAQVRMSNLRGLPSVLNSLMMNFVNSNKGLERAILKAVNGYLDKQKSEASTGEIEETVAPE